MLNPLSPIEVLATNSAFCDTAIDSSDSPDGGEFASGEARLAEYRRTRDRSALVLKPDSKPTLFVCKPLAASLVARLLDERSLPQARLGAFVLGCHEVVLPDGSKLAPKRLSPQVGGAAAPTDENAWVDEIARRFGLDTVYEIGSVIYERARLPESARGPFSYRGL